MCDVLGQPPPHSVRHLHFATQPSSETVCVEGCSSLRVGRKRVRLFIEVRLEHEVVERRLRFRFGLGVCERDLDRWGGGAEAEVVQVDPNPAGGANR